MNGPRPLPAAPAALPFVGHLVPLVRDPPGFLNSLPPYGDLVRVRLGPAAVVVLRDPELTRRALVDDRLFDKGGPAWDRAGGPSARRNHHDHRT